MNISQVDIDRFWSKVNKNGPTMPHMKTRCWQWTASKRGAYGQFKTIKTKTNLGHGGAAHRFSFVLHFGAIMKDKLVCHKCDNSICIRPSHLFQGTSLDNMTDMIKKGRQLHVGQVGTDNPRAKLTEVKVRLMRKLYQKDKGKWPIAKFAEKFGVSFAAAYHAVIGLTWKHVDY